jgi:Leucine rich repeat
MPGLTIVALSGNLFTGTLPGIFGTMANLTYLDVSKNLLTGTVPSADLSQSTSLEELSLSFNSLTGSMDEICSGGGGSSASAASLGILEADCGEVVCPCCTTCCYEEQCESTKNNRSRNKM